MAAPIHKGQVSRLTPQTLPKASGSAINEATSQATTETFAFLANASAAAAPVIISVSGNGSTSVGNVTAEEGDLIIGQYDSSNMVSIGGSSVTVSKSGAAPATAVLGTSTANTTTSKPLQKPAETAAKMKSATAKIVAATTTFEDELKAAMVASQALSESLAKSTTAAKSAVATATGNVSGTESAQKAESAAQTALTYPFYAGYFIRDGRNRKICSGGRGIVISPSNNSGPTILKYQGKAYSTQEDGTFKVFITKNGLNIQKIVINSKPDPEEIKKIEAQEGEVQGPRKIPALIAEFNSLLKRYNISIESIAGGGNSAQSHIDSEWEQLTKFVEQNPEFKPLLPQARH